MLILSYIMDKILKYKNSLKLILLREIYKLNLEYDEKYHILFCFINKIATFNETLKTLINRRTFTNKCIYSAYEWNNKSGDVF